MELQLSWHIAVGFSPTYKCRHNQFHTIIFYMKT